MFRQFLPRRRLQSTNFYRAGASVLPIGFLPRRGPRFTRKYTNKSTVRKQNSTNFDRAVFYRFLRGGFLCQCWYGRYYM